MPDQSPDILQTPSGPVLLPDEGGYIPLSISRPQEPQTPEEEEE